MDDRGSDFDGCIFSGPSGFAGSAGVPRGPNKQKAGNLPAGGRRCPQRVYAGLCRTPWNNPADYVRSFAPQGGGETDVRTNADIRRRERL